MILRSYNWSGSYRKLQKQPFFKKMVNSHFAVVLGNSCILKNAFEETCHNFLILQVFACTISSTRNIPHSLLHLAAAAAAKSLQSCPTLCDPIVGSPPGSPIPGILQARTLQRVKPPQREGHAPRQRVVPALCSYRKPACGRVKTQLGQEQHEIILKNKERKKHSDERMVGTQ